MLPVLYYLSVILAKRGYCNISHCNFVICGPIVTKLDLEVAGYDACIVETYHWNRSNVKIKVTNIVRKTRGLPA